MNENQLKSIIEEVIREHQLSKEPGREESRSSASVQPVKTDTPETIKEEDSVTGYRIEDYLVVPDPENKEAYANYKKSTPARVGIWRSGPRYTTPTYLRFRADHAVAQDAVFTDVSDELIEANGWQKLQTLVADKDEYLTRPDLGRKLDEESVEALRKLNATPPTVQVYVADGLSSTAIETNAVDALKTIEMGLKNQGIQMGTPFFLKYGRVPSMDQVSELTGAQVTAVLIGERPGLATGESMSCYMIYQGKVGNPESSRTVISNIHQSGTPAVEAGAHIAEIIQKILHEKKSGVDLKL